MKDFIKRTPLVPFLERRGLRNRCNETMRWFWSAAERQRMRRIEDDYRSCRHLIEQLGENAPSSDPSMPAWMIGSMHTVWAVKLEGMMSLAVRMAGMTPVPVNPTRFRWVDRYHESFAMQPALNLEVFQGQSKFGEADAAVSPSHMSSLPHLVELMFHGVDVGRIAVSNYIYRNKFSQFNLADEGTQRGIAEELSRVRRNVLAAEKMLAVSRPVMGLILEKGVSPFAEIFGVCVAQDIPVVQYVQSQNTNEYVLKRYRHRNRHQHPFSLDSSLWEEASRMPWSDDHSDGLMNELSESYRQGTWFNRRYLHHEKKIKSREEVMAQLKLDPAKKTAVVFSHVLWDATFFYGTSLFQDYETWLVETVKAACRNPHLNWVIKLHPDLAWKLKYENYSGEIRDAIAIRSEIGKLPQHVRIVSPDTDISTLSFFDITDLCVTVRGTIGIEMACHGIPVFTAGTGRYSGLGFTIDSGTREEYLVRLAKAHLVPMLSDDQTRLAQRFAHTLFRRRPWPSQSFEIVKRSIREVGDPLETNVIFHLDDAAKLREATDLLQLAEWMRSDQIDYVRPV